jgi:short-subunit dehydrogenase
MLRTALVTGASSGIGREIARQLARDRGMTVLATARREDRLKSLAAEFPAGRIQIMAGDIADADFRRRLWARAEELPEGCHLLVNNAGIGHYDQFSDQDPAIVRRIIEVNIVALFDLTQYAAQSMKARGFGQILQVSSILGFVGLPYSAAYVATKHAVNGLVKSVAYELRGSGVRIWAACPGRTASEFARVALGDPGGTGRKEPGAPTDRIVRSIVRGLERRCTFLYPSWNAWGVVQAAHWLPGPYQWFMRRWAPGYFQREIDEARTSGQTATGLPRSK